VTGEPIRGKVDEQKTGIENGWYLLKRLPQIPQQTGRTMLDMSRYHERKKEIKERNPPWQRDTPYMAKFPIHKFDLPSD